MSDESYSFTTARARLEEIVTQVRKKDTSLEKSLDLLEEGVRLANTCTELIDHADWTVGGVSDPVEASEADEAGAVADDAATETLEGEGTSPQSTEGDDEVIAAAFDDSADNLDDTPEYRDDEA